MNGEVNNETPHRVSAAVLPPTPAELLEQEATCGRSATAATTVKKKERRKDSEGTGRYTTSLRALNPLRMVGVGESKHRPLTSKLLRQNSSTDPGASTGMLTGPSTTGKVLISGSVLKWTNYVSLWKLRYFEVVPGAIQYYESHVGTVREQIPLQQCVVKAKAVQELEILRPDGPPLRMKFKSAETKLRWHREITHAKQIVASQSQLGSPSHRLMSSSGGAAPSTPTLAASVPVTYPTSPEDNEDTQSDDLFVIEDDFDTAVPLEKLLELNAKYDRQLQNLIREVGRIEQRLIDLSALVRDPGVGGSIRSMVVTMGTEIEKIKDLTQAHFKQARLVVDLEQQDRQTLLSTLRRELKENYRLGHKLKRGVAPPKPQPSPVLAPQSPPPGRATSDESINKEQTPPDTRPEEEVPLPVTTVPVVGPGSGVAEVVHDEREFYDAEEDEEVKRRSTTLSEEVSSESETLLGLEESEFVATSVGDSQNEEDLTGEEAPGLPKPSDHEYRLLLPMPRTEMKVSMWGLLKDCVGKDLTRIALPVNFNEPLSFLQRLAEDYEYASVLERAALCTDRCERTLMVGLFSATPFASSVGRTYKPFNPLLGETYEISHRGYKFIAEQVGHHPPTSAFHTHGKNFSSHGHITIGTKFTGKSLEIQLRGPSRVLLTNPETNETNLLSFRRPRMIINNVIFGKISMDVNGSYTITNHTTGDFAVIDFPRRSWWSNELHAVRGAAFDKDGCCHWRLSGTWSGGIEIQKVDPSLAPRVSENAFTCEKVVDGMEAHYSPRPIDFSVNWQGVKDASVGTCRKVWKPNRRIGNSDQYYCWGYMTFELNEMAPIYEGTTTGWSAVPPTDSRRRPDQRALEHGDVEHSNREKVRLEEKQRAAARRRKTEWDHLPAWFSRSVDEFTGETAWDFAHQYWNVREGDPAAAAAIYEKKCHDIF